MVANDNSKRSRAAYRPIGIEVPGVALNGAWCRQLLMLQISLYCLALALVSGCRGTAEQKGVVAKEDVARPSGNQGPEAVSDAGPKRQARPRVTILSHEFDDQMLAKLKAQGPLQAVWLRGQFTDEYLKKIIGQFPDMEDLSVQGSEITDAGIAEIARLKRLRKLSLFEVSVTEAGLAHIATMGRLEHLLLCSFERIDDSGLKKLGEVESLRYLALSYPDMTAESLKFLQGLKGLETLSLKDATITGEGLRAARSLKNFTEISLDGCSVTAAGMQCITSLPNLRRLSMWRWGIKADILKLIRTSASIEELTLHAWHIRALAPVGQMPRLRRLRLQGHEFVGKGLGGLGRPKSLETLELRGLELRHADVTALASLTWLRSLDLLHTTEGELGSLLEKLRGLDMLHTIGLHGMGSGDSVVAYLADFKALREVDLSNATITDAGVAKLASLMNLRKLNLMKTEITDDSVDQLVVLRNLRTLDVRRTGISRRGLQRLRRELPTTVVLPEKSTQENAPITDGQ